MSFIIIISTVVCVFQSFWIARLKDNNDILAGRLNWTQCQLDDMIDLYNEKQGFEVR